MKKKTIKIIEDTKLAEEVARELTKNGFTVLKILIESDSRPVITIKNNKLCIRLGGFLKRHLRASEGCKQEYETSFSGVRVEWSVPVKGIV